MIPLPASPNRAKNQERYGGGARDEIECAICAKPIRIEKIRYEIRIHDGGVSVVTDEEAKAMNAENERNGLGYADLGSWPVGSDCLRRFPELKQYANRTIRKENEEMSIKITGLGPWGIDAIEKTYPDRVDVTKTTAKFWGHKDHVLAQLEIAKEKAAEIGGSRTTGPYVYLHAVVRKVRKAKEGSK